MTRAATRPDNTIGRQAGFSVRVIGRRGWTGPLLCLPILFSSFDVACHFAAKMTRAGYDVAIVARADETRAI